MPFSPIKAGSWAFGEVLTSAQMNQLNADFPFAIDGRDGGTYTPTASIVIAGGFGLTLSGNAFVAAGGFFEVLPSGVLQCDTGSFTQFKGSTTFTSACTLSVQCALISTNAAHFSGAVRAPKRVTVGASTAGVTSYAMASYDHVYLDLTGAAAGTIWKVDLTSADSGECIRFVYTNASFGVTIQDQSGATIAFLDTGSGHTYAVTVWNNAGTCLVIDKSFHP
jgi:hypothetical protein